MLSDVVCIASGMADTRACGDGPNQCPDAVPDMITSTTARCVWPLPRSDQHMVTLHAQDWKSVTVIKALAIGYHLGLELGKQDYVIIVPAALHRGH